MCADAWSGRAAQHALEHAARADDLIGLERLERRTPFDPRAMRRQQRIERRRSRRARDRARHRGRRIGSPAAGLSGCTASVGPSPSSAAQARDRLLEAVVGHRESAPRRLDQPVLGDDNTGVGEEMKQHPDVPVGNQHHIPAACDAASSGVDQKVSEGVRRHGSIIRRWTLGFGLSAVGRWAWGFPCARQSLFCWRSCGRHRSPPRTRRPPGNSSPSRRRSSRSDSSGRSMAMTTATRRSRSPTARQASRRGRRGRRCCASATSGSTRTRCTT